MTHILKNENLEVHIDLPNEKYNFSRFDWTGKIVTVKFQNKLLSTVERTDCDNEHAFGKGFYNEFGIDSALGFDDAPIGGWFHKIGVGLLKKDDNQYQFTKKYDIIPANFEVSSEANKIVITCRSKAVHGYAYILTKEIELHENTFTITYNLHNTGEKDISTDEYVHNFTAIENDLIGPNYELKFPFQLIPELFNDTVNPDEKVNIGQHEMTFNATTNEQFFFSNITGTKNVNAAWQLINTEHQIGIRETGNFQTTKINLWGWKHVISPELFYTIFIKPGQSATWKRTFTLFKVA